MPRCGPIARMRPRHIACSDHDVFQRATPESMQQPPPAPQRLSASLAAAAAIILAIWADLLLSARGEPQFVFLASSLAVAATAWLAGFVPALAAIAVTAIATDFFILGRGAWLDAGGAPTTLAF